MSDTIRRLNAALEDRYRVQRELGEGGMATVYLADDLKHERQVAIKVLKPDLAAVVGGDRFLAEIRTTANLQHPHILPLFDSGEADGFLYYVMPYVEGESLRERLDREKQLPVDEAVALTVKVAAALQAAHERGVVHRDIKPANILLQNGEPLVADFGIALAMSQAGGGRLTETGLSLGTPYYMAPEQAMADRDPDQRSDLYSLACVTYEMLAGDPPFAASTAQAVLAKILTGSREPVEELRPATPAHVAAAVDRALERLSADRFRSVRDFAEALTDPGFGAGGNGGSATGVTGGRIPKRDGVRRRMATGALILILAAAALAGWLRSGGSPGPSFGPVPVTESRIYTPPQVRVELETEFALSPSGDRLLFTGWDSAGVARIWMRSLAGESLTPLPGTENGAYPFWAPDEGAVGFTARGALRVLDLETGRVRVLCDVDAANPATWTRDDVIYFSRLAAIHRTEPDGEACEQVTDPDEGGTNHVWPTVLPGGRLVYSAWGETASLWVVEPGRAPTRLVDGGRNATFVPPDWLVYHDNPIRDGGSLPLLARRIDVESLEFLTPPAPIFDSIFTPTGTARYSVSSTGVLVAARAPASANTEIVWVDRSGEIEARARSDGWTLDASSRGRRVVIGGWGLWTWDPSRRVVEQLPPSLGLRRIHQQPAWSPGDSLLAFPAFIDGPEGLFTYRFRDGQVDTLRTGRVDDVAWTPGGDTLIYRVGAGAERPQAEVRLHVRSSGHDERLFSAPAGDPIQQTLEVSPDGRWLLYSSTASGVDDLYVRAWPELDAPRRVTSNGGLQGHWSVRGDTIFYRTGAHELMAVPFGIDGPGSLGAAESLGGSDDLFEFWGVDGESGHFLRRERLEADRPPPIRLVTNWIGRAEGRVP